MSGRNARREHPSRPLKSHKLVYLVLPKRQRPSFGFCLYFRVYHSIYLSRACERIPSLFLSDVTIALSSQLDMNGTALCIFCAAINSIIVIGPNSPSVDVCLGHILRIRCYPHHLSPKVGLTPRKILVFHSDYRISWTTRSGAAL